jgi:hypothetical protein
MKKRSLEGCFRTVVLTVDEFGGLLIGARPQTRLACDLADWAVYPLGSSRKTVSVIPRIEADTEQLFSAAT